MKIDHNDHQNFGWNYRTHYRLTKTAAENFPEFKRYGKFLGLSAIAPDIMLSTNCIDATYRFAHSFYGRNLMKYDTVPQNAGDYFLKCMSEALYNFKNGNNKTGMFKAGNALHFLQDVACPLHSQEGNLKVINLLKHRGYEGVAKHNPQIITNIAANFVPPQINKSFLECFMDTYKKSSTMADPYSIPQGDWMASVSEALTNAYENTYLFFKRLSKLTNAPHSKAEEIFAKEAYETFRLI